VVVRETARPATRVQHIGPIRGINSQLQCDGGVSREEKRGRHPRHQGQNGHHPQPSFLEGNVRLLKRRCSRQQVFGGSDREHFRGKKFYLTKDDVPTISQSRVTEYRTISLLQVHYICTSSQHALLAMVNGKTARASVRAYAAGPCSFGTPRFPS
jgi:hypothetical protein